MVGSQIQTLSFSAVQAFGSEANGDCTPPIICPEAEPPIKAQSLSSSTSILGANHKAVAMDGILYFDANNPESQLHSFDPTSNTIHKITSFSSSGSYGGQIGKFGGLAILDHVVYFDASTSSSGSELWGYSPANDTYWMTEEIRPGVSGSNPGSTTG